MVRILKTPFLTQGPAIREFEKKFAGFCGAKYAIACGSATAGLHLSAMALGMGPGHRWWTSPNTFCATADAALRCGASVDFIDIEWGTYNLDLGLLEKRLREASRVNRLPQVVAPVHFAGNPVDMEALDRLRKRYAFRVVEDAAHATGAELRGEKVGSCKWSDLCVFSFHAVKIMTTGEGGMVTTNSAHLYEKLCRLRTHGISRDLRHLRPNRKMSWYYEKLELGNHYRMTDIQAALGTSQLKKINRFLAAREAIAENYNEKLKELPLDLPQITRGARSSWHLYPVCVRGNLFSRDKIMRRLHRAGVLANLHYPPVPHFRIYRGASAVLGPCPVADQYASRALSLPMYPGLSKKDLVKVTRIMPGMFS